MDIQIPTMKWQQIGGDMDPATHGAIIATADGSAIELLEIQPVRSFVGDREATEVGFPFWTKEAYYTLEALDPSSLETRNALNCFGISMEALTEMTPDVRALAIAEACLSYGLGSKPGPCGWARDILPCRVQWWSSKRPNGWRFLESEDIEFRQLVRELG